MERERMDVMHGRQGKNSMLGRKEVIRMTC